VNNGDPQQTKGQKNKNKCPNCAPPGDQSIYVPLIDLPEAQGSELVFNSRSTKDVAVTPVFYKRDGTVVTGDPVTVHPTEIRYAEVRSLTPKPYRNEHDWGGMSLSFYGTPREIWSQFRFLGVNGGGSVDEFFVVPNEQRADTQEAAWWMPRRSRAVIALGNLSDNETGATVDFGGGETREVRLAPRATEIVRREHAGAAGVESVRVSITGAPGSVVPTGVIESQDGSFNSVIRFYDPKHAKQPNLFANGLRLSGVTPHMVLKNTTSAPVTAQPTFIPPGGDDTGPVVLPEVYLGPNETTEVDLSALLQAVSSRGDLGVVSAQVTSSGAPGSLIGSLYVINDTTGADYDVPLRDSGPVRSMTGAYPWKISDDFRTVVYLTNITDREAEFVVQINYAGGKFVMAPRKLKAGETAAFDMLKMRDGQWQDSAGHTLPRDVSIGQFTWAQRGVTGGKIVLIGRAEVVSRSRQISTSYSCPQDCGLTYDASIDPVPAPRFVGDTATGTAWETGTSNTGYTVGPYQASADWSVDNLVATFDPSSAVSTTATGTDAGTATLTAFLGMQEVYEFDGLECVDMGSQPEETSGEIAVTPTVNGANVIWWLGGVTDESNYPSTITLTVSPSDAPSYQWTERFKGQVISTATTSTNHLDVVAGTNVSRATDDFSYTVTANGLTSPPLTFTVRTPYSIQAVNGFPQTSLDTVTGWVTTAQYTVFDQLGDQLTNGFNFNEHFTNQANDSGYPNSNWGFTDQNPSNAGNLVTDTFTPPALGIGDPRAFNPQNPLGTDKVHHGTQTYRVGSSTAGQGKSVCVDTLQFYRDHAGQNGLTTPSEPLSP
jgi:hypothetical protein